MAELAVLPFGDVLFCMTSTATVMERIFLSAGTAITTVTINAGPGPDPVMVTGLAIADLLFVEIMGEVNTRHSRTAEP